MEFVLGEIYAKFYICQILKSMSYYDSKMKQLDFQMLIEENYEDSEENSKELGNSQLENDSMAGTQRTRAETQNNSQSKTKEFRESLSMYDNSLYRRYFVFKGIVYSQVEIQGLVIEKRGLSQKPEF